MRKSPVECRGSRRTGENDGKSECEEFGVKVYWTVASPAQMHGAETWELKKAQEKKLEVAKM